MAVGLLVADPPWRFTDKLGERGADANYPTLSVAQICVYPLPKELPEDCVLFLWRVAAMQSEALEVCRNWGFTPKSELVWLKLTTNRKPFFGMGRYVRNCHESCIIATRGKAYPSIKNVRSVFEGIHGVHSQKPHEFYSLVERMYPDAIRFELFARVIRPGWNQSGQELGKLGNDDPRQVRMFEGWGK